MPFIEVSDVNSVPLDYIVVGGGTAGLALAARLAEDPSISVLVIEAGAYHGSVPDIDIPGFIGRALRNPTYDWNFATVPQQHAKDKVVSQPRGKGLGGSSLINYLGMFHPSKLECDALEELGNKGWNWESLSHYMKKSETTFPSDLQEAQAKLYATVRDADPKLHGSKGPIIKSLPREWTDAHARLFDAAENLGIPRNPETGRGINVGSNSPYCSIDHRTATRSYAGTAYLKPNISRSNFLVLTEAQVTKVILQPRQDGLHRAIGVEIAKDGARLVINGVRRDVVLSAGAFQTPQILELSGIGNPEILAQNGISCAIDLPGVGENLQDHILVSTIAEIMNDDETFDVMRDPVFVKKHEELYKDRRGLLAFIPSRAFIFLSAKQLGVSGLIPFWENHANASLTRDLASTAPSLRAGLEKQYKVQRKFMEAEEQAQAEILQYIGHSDVPNSVPVPGKRYTRLSSAIMHPLSRGSVHVASGDPLAPPSIDPKYLSNKADLDLLVQAIQFVIRLYNTAPLKEIIKSIVLPPAEALKDEESLREYATDHFISVYHPVGSASMLPSQDGGVVDSELRVYGTSNLRVVDLSIMPLELSCHPQSVAYAIGEKAADMIKSEFLNSQLGKPA